MTAVGDVLWRPDADELERSGMAEFQRFLERTRGLSFDGYHALWRWSVENLEEFWAALWEFMPVEAATPYDQVLTTREMPGARWFTGARLNYAQHELRGAGAPDDHVAVISTGQTRDRVDLTWGELRDQVARARAGLQRLGIGKGDRVAAYLPNIPETLVAFLATASLGAIWSSCAPEFGTRSVVDRFSQIAPALFLTVDGYRYGTKDVDRSAEIAEIRAGLGGNVPTVVVPYLPGATPIPDALPWSDLLRETAPMAFEPVPFDHPLYIVYSSGTTGLPKPIVHGHGGILLEHFKSHRLQSNLGLGDRVFWFTTTGWVMWNILVSALLTGSTLVMFDGNLAHPDLMALWRLAADTGVRYFGVSAGFLLTCRRAGLTPGKDVDLSALRTVGSTGSPLSLEGYDWVYANVKGDVLLGSGSGGTDVASGFVGGVPTLPVYAGEMSGRLLGCDVVALDPDGNPVIGERGELVLRSPMPSMPVGFWNDTDGSRLKAAYFEFYPGLWRHGDWLTITDRGTCIISGRSDSTLNRGGVRLGTGEFYSVVEELPEVVDSLVVHMEGGEDGMGRLLLFVVLTEGATFDDDLRRRIAVELRSKLSPRHVPDEILPVPGIPRTLSGKKLEVPVKRILKGDDTDKVASRGALANPETLEAFEELAPGVRARSAG